MASNPAQHATFYLGVDGGGSKCKVRLISSDGLQLGVGVAGPANPVQGLEQTFSSILAATGIALEEAGLTQACLADTLAGVGLAGVNIPTFYDAVKAWHHPFRAMHLTTDVHIACLGAHGGGDGAVVIVGTGSCGFASVKGANKSCGAHGFPYGDKGSGAWIGLEAVKAALLAVDGLGPKTLLSEALTEKLGAKDSSIMAVMAGASPAQYAKIAPLVFDLAQQGDELAQNIIREGAGYISDVADMLWRAGPPRMSLLGGLSNRMMPWLRPKVAAKMLPPLDQPEAGALFFAQQAAARRGAAAS